MSSWFNRSPNKLPGGTRFTVTLAAPPVRSLPSEGRTTAFSTT